MYSSNSYTEHPESNKFYCKIAFSFISPEKQIKMCFILCLLLLLLTNTWADEQSGAEMQMYVFFIKNEFIVCPLCLSSLRMSVCLCI